MKIVILWNNIYDNQTGHRTSIINSYNHKTAAELIMGWITANGRKPKDVIIHNINVDNFIQKQAGKKSGKNMTPEQRKARAKKAALASVKARQNKKAYTPY